MPVGFKRAQFFYMHTLKCPKCREEWWEVRESLPESKRNKALEKIVAANHESTNVDEE